MSASKSITAVKAVGRVKDTSAKSAGGVVHKQPVPAGSRPADKLIRAKTPHGTASALWDMILRAHPPPADRRQIPSRERRASTCGG